MKIALFAYPLCPRCGEPMKGVPLPDSGGRTSRATPGTAYWNDWRCRDCEIVVRLQLPMVDAELVSFDLAAAQVKRECTGRRHYDTQLDADATIALMASAGRPGTEGLESRLCSHCERWQVARKKTATGQTPTV